MTKKVLNIIDSDVQHLLVCAAVNLNSLFS